MAKKSIQEEIQDLIKLEQEIPSQVPELIDITQLTPKQLLFVSEYVKSGEARSAALKAGYAEASAAVSAHNLLNHPKIIEAIDKVYTAMRLAAEEPKSRVEQELYELLIEAKTQGNQIVMLKAIDLICKINGLYAPTTQLTQDNSLTINYIVPQSADTPKIIDL